VRRLSVAPRPDWERRCEEKGFGFHSLGGRYWDESACWAFSVEEIDELEAATAELHRLCIEACEHVVAKSRYAELAIEPVFQRVVADSWRRGEPTLFGRFDLSYDGSGPPKMLEYNADTPTALIEASVAQWFWLEDTRGTQKGPGRDADQFNSLHEKLIERWKAIAAEEPGATLYFACVDEHEEDEGNVEYLRDTAIQAGVATKFLYVKDIGWDSRRNAFVDGDDNAIEWLFKLYPWEWIAREDFGANVAKARCTWVEPAWKMLLSNKAILAILWELNPGHPNLLPCYRDAAPLAGKDYVRKPVLAREGENISLRSASGAMSTPGTYGAEGYVFQQYAPIAREGANHAVIGSWIVGSEPAGMGIREDDSPITRNTSRFVPHFFS
jgi:glutathionylspermidine synthase